MSRELMNRAAEIVESVEIPERHSYFQIEKFMIGKEPTGQSQAWQIIKEIKVRKESIEALQLQLEETADTIEELTVKTERLGYEIRKLSSSLEESDQFTVRLKEIQIRRLERKRTAAEQSLEKLRTKLKYIMEEVGCLINGYEKLRARLGEVRPMDDPVAQAELWNEKFLEEFNLRVLLKHPLDTDLIRSIMALDDDAPVKKHVVLLLSNIQKQMVAERDRQLALLAQEKTKTNK